MIAYICLYIYIYIYIKYIIYNIIYIYIFIFIYTYINTNLPRNAIVRLPLLGVEIARVRKRLQQPLLTRKPATMTQSAQTTIPPYQP